LKITKILRRLLAKTYFKDRQQGRIKYFKTQALAIVRIIFVAKAKKTWQKLSLGIWQRILEFYMKDYVNRFCESYFRTSEDGILMSDFMHQVTNRLYANDNQLTVSFINGPAFGGGSELATATDLRIASPKAKLATVHKNLALQPGWAGATRLVRVRVLSLMIQLAT